MLFWLIVVTDVPVPLTVVISVAQEPPLSQSVASVVPELSPVTTALEPLIVTEATLGLVLLERE